MNLNAYFNPKKQLIMFKWIKKFFYITDKKDIREEELENKSLEDLLTEKDSEHDFISINIPIIFSCV